jgi:4-hydroxy-tetrahydrodipicolinate reductase
MRLPLALLLARASGLELTVMMNGLPGAMGREIAAACLRRSGVSLAPFALTGDNQPDSMEVDDGSGGSPQTVKLYPPCARDELAAAVKEAYPTPGSLVCVDFTHPSAVNTNSDWYVKHELPFGAYAPDPSPRPFAHALAFRLSLRERMCVPCCTVMGTTGGDRDALMSSVQASSTYAVIAPNMAKQIVALQAALEQMAADFPHSFEGYSLSVAESHQSTKADTSGTAKAISASLATLTGEEATFTNDAIERVRDPPAQLAGGGASHRGVSPVPEKGLDGHAFHTYSLLSADGDVEFQIRHNVVGRSTYAEGTVDACIFLAGRCAADAPKRVYDMVDVLKEGAL